MSDPAAAEDAPPASSSLPSSPPPPASSIPLPPVHPPAASDQDSYSVLDTHTRPIDTVVHSASRYVRMPGEPSLAFFLRERNSLSAYVSSSPSPSVDPQDAAMERLERKYGLSGAAQDLDARGPQYVSDKRHEKPSQRRQRDSRNSLRAQRAQKLMQTLKLLLHFKGR